MNVIRLLYIPRDVCEQRRILDWGSLDGTIQNLQNLKCEESRHINRFTQDLLSCMLL